MIEIPLQAEKALNLLNEAGFEAFVVGGMVRNRIMGLDLSDIDITTNATPDQTKKVFSGFHIIETGLKHGTITVRIDHAPIEITTYRTESTYSDNRHPDGVTFTNSLKDDCSRRDFTVNSICYNPSVGVVDYYGGVQDIEKGLIRCVGNADKRFQEDALRILRAIRFASVLGFDMEENTRKSIFKNAHLLKNVSAERIYTEFSKLLCGESAGRIITEYTEVIAVFIPEIMALKGFQQHNIHHIYDVLMHTAVVVDSVPAIPQLRLAALLHDFGKPETFTMDENGTGHFYGHNKASERIAKNVLKRLKVSNDDYDLITKLVKYHDVIIETNEKAVRRALNKYGQDFLQWLMLLKRGDNAGQNIALFNRTEEYNKLDNLIQEILEKQQCFSLKQLAINGGDLVNIGIPPSKEIGRILNTLLEMVINEEIANEKDVLLSKAKEMLK